MSTHAYCLFFFFFNDTATTEIYTLSLHDALPICDCRAIHQHHGDRSRRAVECDGVPQSISVEIDHAEQRRFICTRSEEHTSELQSPCNLVCRLLLEKKKAHALPLGSERRLVGPT